MKNFILVIIIFTVTILYGQNKNDKIYSDPDSSLIVKNIYGKIEGVIKDKDGLPLQNATISVINTQRFSSSDKEGKYYIYNVKKGKYDLNISYFSEEYKIPNIIFYSDSVLSIEFTLTEVSKVEHECGGLPTIEANVDYDEIKVAKDVKTAKPIIYLYPEKETEVNVKLNYKGTFTATYPKYPENGWTVTAKPDGILKDKSGKEYYSLFWEGITDKTFTLDEGFIVKREDAAAFLEKSLRTIGLNFREANEFIIYWLPELEKHPYNLIHFSTKEYEELAKLTVTPKPDTVIRVFMVFKGLDKPIEVKPQTLIPKVRKGFTVVEWGGNEVTGETKNEIR